MKGIQEGYYFCNFPLNLKVVQNKSVSCFCFCFVLRRRDSRERDEKSRGRNVTAKLKKRHSPGMTYADPFLSTYTIKSPSRDSCEPCTCEYDD